MAPPKGLLLRGCQVLAEWAVFPLHLIVGGFALYGALLAAGGPKIRCGVLLYTAWVYFDKSPDRGGLSWAWRSGLSRFLRGGLLWRLAADGRGPITLERSVPLPPEDGPYIFVCHPHGMIGVAISTHFGTTVTGFDKLFPGIPLHLLGGGPVFWVPVLREVLLMHGHGTVDRSCCKGLLKKGHSIALAPGGARESLESVPGTMRLIVQRRKGFAKLAVSCGAAVVPVLTFGENELYETVQFEEGSWGRWCQQVLIRVFRFSLPVFVGRSWLLPLLPRRGALHTVVGAPVRLEKSDADGAGGGKSEEALVEALHAEYCQALRKLFDEHKAAHGFEHTELELL